MKFKQGWFRADDLVPCTKPIFRWGCPGCYATFTLEPDDPRASAGVAPRCDRCGDFLCPSNADAPSTAS